MAYASIQREVPAKLARKLAASNGRTDRVGYSLPVSSVVAVTRITRGPLRRLRSSPSSPISSSAGNEGISARRVAGDAGDDAGYPEVSLPSLGRQHTSVGETRRQRTTVGDAVVKADPAICVRVQEESGQFIDPREDTADDGEVPHPVMGNAPFPALDKGHVGRLRHPHGLPDAA